MDGDREWGEYESPCAYRHYGKACGDGGSDESIPQKEEACSDTVLSGNGELYLFRLGGHSFAEQFLRAWRDAEGQSGAVL